MKVLVQLKFLPAQADLSIQEKKEFEEKIKLENKLINTSNNKVLHGVI